MDGYSPLVTDTSLWSALMLIGIHSWTDVYNDRSLKVNLSPWSPAMHVGTTYGHLLESEVWAKDPAPMLWTLKTELEDVM